ncbi:MAG TPA: hypothetical protein ENI51_03010 [Candidatus Atribacteria bacterium]|nr:hypothetical protein [Candidatus Atribacteria bacterium]
MVPRLGLFILLFLILPQNSFAYLDPGTGSYFFQIIIAFILGGIFGIKMFWRRITRFVKSLFTHKKV